jgi:hypothetical protein
MSVVINERFMTIRRFARLHRYARPNRYYQPQIYPKRFRAKHCGQEPMQLGSMIAPQARSEIYPERRSPRH